MSNPDFTQYAPEPFGVHAPVCKQIESIAATLLVDHALSGVPLAINYGPIMYGPSLDALQSASAFFITFESHLNSLVLLCPEVHEVEGMVTGTSLRRRLHRPYCGGAKPGNWHEADQALNQKLVRLESERNIRVPESDSYLALLMSLLKLHFIHDVVGPSFVNNITAYSKLLTKMNILEQNTLESN